MYCYKNFASIYDELIYGDVDYSDWCEKILKICEEYSLERKKLFGLSLWNRKFNNRIRKIFSKCLCCRFVPRNAYNSGGKNFVKRELDQKFFARIYVT